MRMMKKILIALLFCFTFISAISYIRILINAWNKEHFVINERVYHQEEALINCLMITGKNNERIELAKKSVNNFLDQTYMNKKLVIVNHHPYLTVLNNNQSDNLFEFRVDKTHDISLGELRNMSLQMVALNSYWIPWDDDDYRSNDFLSVLFEVLRRNKADAVVFTRRYEYNMNTQFAWQMQLKSGFPIILCKHNPLIKYEDKDTMEDVNLIQSVRDKGMKVLIYDNHPRLYIRVVHKSNTSLFVKKNKINISSNLGVNIKYSNYVEENVDDSEKKYIVNKVNDILATS